MTSKDPGVFLVELTWHSMQRRWVGLGHASTADLWPYKTSVKIRGNKWRLKMWNVERKDETPAKFNNKRPQKVTETQ